MKKIFSLLTAVVLVVSAVAVPEFIASADTWSYPESTPELTWTGDGTEDDPYIIDCAQELADLSYMVNNGTLYDGEYFRLDSDIDLSDGEWVPIGHRGSSSDMNSNQFKGRFDGNYHVVSNITVAAKFNCLGLFGCFNLGTGNEEEVGIKNLGVENVQITLSEIPQIQYRCGGLAGNATRGIVDGCYAKNVTIDVSALKFQAFSLGGLVGQCGNSATVKNCYVNTASFVGAGGLSYIPGGTGGLAGYAADTVSIINSYAVDVSFSGINGGHGRLIGRESGSLATISNVYSNQVGAKDVRLADLIFEASAEAMLAGLGEAFMEDVNSVNDGYPVLVWDEDLNKVITLEKYGEGTVDIPEAARAGAEVNFTVNPAEGYVVESVFAGETQLSVPYKFTMPSEGITVVVRFAEDKGASVMSNINDAISEEDASKLVSIINDDTDLELNKEEYNSLTSGGALNVADLIVGHGSFVNSSEFKSYFYKCVFTANLNEMSDTEVLKSGFTKLLDNDVDAELASVIDFGEINIPEFVLSDIPSDLRGQEYKDFSTVADEVRRLILVAYKAASNDSDAMSLVFTNSENVFAIPDDILSLYNSSSAKDVVCDKLYGINNSRILSMTVFYDRIKSILEDANGDEWKYPTSTLSLWSGSGTEESPYFITTAQELANLSYMVSSGNTYQGIHFKLVNDINLGNKKWTPIGNNTYIFMGIFDGGNHVVSNLVIKSNTLYQGLFGRFGNSSGNAVLKNLGVENVYIEPEVTVNQYRCGGICGSVCAEIENCYVKNIKIEASQQKNMFSFGGIAGQITNNAMCTVERCYVNGAEFTENSTFLPYSGGLIGYSSITGSPAITLRNCYTANITFVNLSGKRSRILMQKAAVTENVFTDGSSLNDENLDIKFNVSADEMFKELGSNGFKEDTYGINGGYPILDTEAEPTKYNISVDIAGNGKVDVPKSAAENAEIQITVTPDNGYMIKYLTVDGVKLFKPYVFDMPAHDVVIKAEFSGDVLKEVNKAISDKDADELVDILMKQNEFLGLNQDEFMKIGKNGRKGVGELLIKNNSFSDLEDLSDAFYADILIYCLNASENDDIIKSALKSVTELCSDKDFANYSNFADKYIGSSAFENNVLSFKGKNLDSYDGLKNKICIKLLKDFKAAISYYKMTDVIFTNEANVFGLPSDLITDYSGASAKVKIQQDVYDLLKSDVSSMDKFYDELRGIIKKNSDSGSTGGSGSGKGGTSKGALILTPMDGNYDVIPEPEIFNDLGSVLWAKDAIVALYNQGIINGREESVFDPSANVTRGEFAHIIANALNLQTKLKESPFKDITSKMYNFNSVLACYEAGIVMGYGDTFGTDDFISRQDMAVMLFKAAKHLERDLSAEDVKPADLSDASDYAKDAVVKMMSAKLLNGREGNVFAMHENLTRAEAAVAVYSLIKP